MVEQLYHVSGGQAPASYHYTNFFEAMDGDPDKIMISDPSSDGGALIMPRSLGAGRAILAAHVPTRLLRGGPGTRVQPLLDIYMWRTGALLVPEAFKHAVECLEPGTHQFFPMEYFEGGGLKIGEGYLFIICKRLDTLHDTACRPPRDARGFVPRSAEGEIRRVVFSADKIAGHHVWTDKFQRGRLISGVLAERLQQLNLTGLVLEPLLAE